MFNNSNMSDMAQIISYATRKYVEDCNASSKEQFLLALETMYEMNFCNIDLATVYTLKTIYDNEPHIFNNNIQNHLQMVFYNTFRNIPKLRIDNIEKEIMSINQRIEATSNMYNPI